MTIGILLLTHNDIGSQLLLAAKTTYGSVPIQTELLSIDHYDQPSDLINLAFCFSFHTAVLNSCPKSRNAFDLLVKCSLN